MKRLGYRKTRTGCLRCKQRRVKCDERVPCSACIRHEIPCSLESPSTAPLQPLERNNARISARERKSFPVSSPSEPSEDHISPSSTTGLFSYFAHFPYSSPGASDDRAWISDIELMHHYTAEAHQTLYAPCHHDIKVLQTDISREGLAYPFLLHQILAFSALHLAYLNPNSRHKYLVQASQHQGIAISTMNSMLAKPWDPDACHALYGTSIFVAISAFGTFPSCDRYNSFRSIDGLIDIFILTQGMHVILRSSEGNIRKGPLGKLINGYDCQPASASTGHAIMMSQLEHLRSSLEDRTFGIDQDKRKILAETIDYLSKIIQRARAGVRAASRSEQRIVFGWPMGLPSSYLALLRNNDPLALTVLSYYCMLMHSCEAKCWYFQGWPDVLMESIIASVTGTPWEAFIYRPREPIRKMERTSEEQGSIVENRNE